MLLGVLMGRSWRVSLPERRNGVVGRFGLILVLKSIGKVSLGRGGAWR